MEIPQKTRETLQELARAFNELQTRHNLILDTLAQTAGIEGQYKVEGTYEALVPVEA